MTRVVLYQLICNMCDKTIWSDKGSPALPHGWYEDQGVHLCQRCNLIATKAAKGLLEQYEQDQEGKG